MSAVYLCFIPKVCRQKEKEKRLKWISRAAIVKIIRSAFVEKKKKKTGKIPPGFITLQNTLLKKKTSNLLLVKNVAFLQALFFFKDFFFYKLGH